MNCAETTPHDREADSSESETPTAASDLAPRPSHSELDNANRCSTFVLMKVETLGVARSLGSALRLLP
jgi:hypothetical protein